MPELELELQPLSPVQPHLQPPQLSQFCRLVIRTPRIEIRLVDGETEGLLHHGGGFQNEYSYAFTFAFNVT